MRMTLEDWILNKKQQLQEKKMIKTDTLLALIHSLRGVIFPGYSDEILDSNTYIELKINCLKQNLAILLHDIEEITKKKLEVNEIIQQFVNQLPAIDEVLKTDLEAIFAGDPAASSEAEIILCYPGLYAIFIYRVAHELTKLGVPLLPRILSEHAHSKTGIDIHPGATIGHHFFIDHGTGIVIGETTTIGNYVKLYQGVTLGALSLKDGQRLKGSKRHPTILDHVTIYSEASIFGGETVIGPNVTIGSNAFITESVPENRVVRAKDKRTNL